MSIFDRQRQVAYFDDGTPKPNKRRGLQAMFLRKRARKNKLAMDRYGRPYGGICSARKRAIDQVVKKEERDRKEKRRKEREIAKKRFWEALNIVFQK